ncbi:MAG: tetratricopeptide repeat protein [Acidobacteria bacterium]|nr:MAG: tetratricopeptide repeat protein [Acidobacteriota bacterium]
MRSLSLLAIVAVAVGAVTAAPEEQQLTDGLADANRRFEQGDFRGAIDGFESFLADSPDHYEILYKLARSYHELDEQAGFDQAIRRVLALNPQRAQPFVLMGRRFQWEGRFPDAEKAYRRALELNPESIESLAGLADVCLARGARQEGLGYLEQIVQGHPNNVPYLWMLARSSQNRQRQAELYRQILQASPHGDVVAKGRLALLEARWHRQFVQIEGLDRPQRIRLFYTPADRKNRKQGFRFHHESKGAVEGWALRVATPNTPYVRLHVNGMGPYKFLLDTGTQGVHVSRVLAKKLGLESFGKSRFEGLGGGSILYGEIVFLDSLQLGRVKVRNVPAEAIDLVGIGDGIINPAILGEVRVQIENSRRSLRLSRWPEEGEEDPIRLEASHRLGAPVTMPFLSFHGHTIIRVELQGLVSNALLDTGAENTVLDLSVLEAIPALQASPVSGYGITLQGLTGALLDAQVVQDIQIVLAGQNFRVVDLFAADLRRMTNFYGPEIHAVLGMEQLRHFDMTFDYRRNEITFQRNLR